MPNVYVTILKKIRYIIDMSLLLVETPRSWEDYRYVPKSVTIIMMENKSNQQERKHKSTNSNLVLQLWHQRWQWITYEVKVRNFHHLHFYQQNMVIQQQQIYSSIQASNAKAGICAWLLILINVIYYVLLIFFLTGTVTKHHTTVVQGRRLRDDDDGEQALIMMGQFKLSLTKAKAVRTKDEIRCSFIVMTIYMCEMKSANLPC